MDAFATISTNVLHTGSTMNLEPYRNAYSPYSKMDQVLSYERGDQVLVDTNYGLCYDRWILRGGAPYGIAAAIPDGPLHASASGYVRIPFGKVPRFHVRDREEVGQVISRIDGAYPGLRLLFRGQNRLYTLGRNADTLTRLYGSDDAVEPSLLPSSVRRGVDTDRIGPVWCGVLRWMLDAFAHDDPQLFNFYHELGTHYLFHRFSLAIAQHYGLPSNGLDVSASVEVALYFALHEFTALPLEPYVLASRVSTAADGPILYVFGFDIDAHYARYEGRALQRWPTTRPSRQDAFFLHRGWGMARNRAARSLLAVLDLDPAGDYGTLPTTKHLFPGADEDLVGVAIHQAKEQFGGDLPELALLLADFAWVVE